MLDLRQKIVVVFLVALMVLPLYAGMVDVVNALQGHDLIESFELRSDRKLNVTSVLSIGDTLIVAATSGLADRYELEIYCNSSSVFVQTGAFDEGSAQIPVPLNPPEFVAGNLYLVVFVAYAFDYPIPGAWTSDTMDSGYAIVAVDTKIDLWVNYDASFRSLALTASLATTDGFPIPDEQVDFTLQFNKQRRNEGSIQLASVTTKSDGSANANLAFGLPDGNYSVRAVHKANGNFGRSENTTEIGVFFNVAFGGLDSGSKSVFSTSHVGSLDLGHSSAFSASYVGNLTLSVSSLDPYALLPMNATASYVSDTPLLGPFNATFFYLDDVSSGSFAGINVEFMGGPPYVYEGHLVWSPNATGFHTLIAGIVSGDGHALTAAAKNGTGLVATGEVDLDIQRCPSNIVLDFPKALYGGVAPVTVVPITVAVSQPRPYQASYDNFSSSFSLASQFSYNGATYAIDEGAESVPVRFYVNGTQVLMNSTDAYGLANFPVTLNFTDVKLKFINVTLEAAVDNCSIFWAEPVERVASFSRVRVYDNRTAFDSSFNLNYTVNGLFGGGELYVDVDNPVRVEASLLNQSAMSIPLAVIIAQLVSSSLTNASGKASVPGGSNYLRVNNTIALVGDVNADGKVDGKDSARIAKAYGSLPGWPKWDVDADLNHDNKVDGKDSALVSKNYGTIGDRVIFNSGQTIYVDSQGAACIPAGASSLTFYRNSQATSAFIEFFFTVLNQTYLTDNLGQVLTTWKPLSLDRYLTQFKLLRKFDLTITPQTSITGLDASTNLIAYFDVVKRPIELSVDYEPSQPTLDDEVRMYASCFDTALGEYVEGSLVAFYIYDLDNYTYVLLGSANTNSSGIATISWLPRNYYGIGGMGGYFVLLANVAETAETAGAEKVPIPVDTRYPTKLEFLIETVTLPVGQPYNFTVRFVRADNGSPVVGRKILEIYTNLNDTEPGYGYADNGTMIWEWSPPAAGTYWLRVKWNRAMGDIDYQPPDEAMCVVVANVVPMFVEFDVSPREFEPGSSITLTAKVLNASDSLPLANYLVTFYAVDTVGHNLSIGERMTNASGFAVLPYTYGIEPYAFRVRIAAGQQVITSPIMLTVAMESSLFLNVTRVKDSFRHEVSGKLLSKSEPMEGKRVKIFVNGTEYLELGSVYTGNDGIFRREITLEPKDNKPTSYQLTVSFEGDNPSNVTAYEYTPNGTRYVACTTLQYGYKPSSNTVALTVEPLATQAAAATPDAAVTQTPEDTTVTVPPAKTPEQIQQEMGTKGWLSFDHQFSWFWPFYRLHTYIAVSSLRLHLAFNPILPGGEEAEWEGIEFWSALTADALAELRLDLFGLFAQYLAAKALSFINPAIAAAIMGVKFAIQAIDIGYWGWNDKIGELASGIVNILMALMALKMDLAGKLVLALCNVLVDATAKTLNWIFQGLLQAVGWGVSMSRSWIDYFEIFGDVGLGIAAIARWAGLW